MRNHIYKLHHYIRTPENLGIAYLGNPQKSIVSVLPENRIDRAEYERRLAELESDIVTPFVTLFPPKNEWRKS